VMFSFFLIHILGNCDFLNPNTISKTVASFGKSSASLFSGKFGYSEPPADLGTAIKSEKIIDYVIGNIGFGAIILVFFVIILIYSIIGCCAFCCCCKPKKSSKPKMFSPLTICHIITTVFLIISVVFFCIGAFDISNGIDQVSQAPKHATYGVGNITFVIASAGNATLKDISDNFDIASSLIGSYVSFLNEGLSSGSVHTKASTASSSMSSYYDSTFQSYTSDSFTCSDNNIKTAISNMIENAQSTIGKVQTSSGLILDTQIQEKIESARNNSNSNRENSMTKISQNLEDVRKNSLEPMIQSVSDISTKAISSFDDIEKLLDKIKTAMRTVVIIATVIYGLLVFLLAVAYFFNSCFSRCVVFCDWLIFIIIAICIILPGALFGALYIPIYDSCPILEKAFINFVDNDFPLPSDAIVDILYCKEEKPLYELGNMSSFLDIDVFVQDIKDSISGSECTVNIQTSDLNDQFGNFGNGLSVDQITSNGIWENYESILTTASSDSECGARAGELKTLINNHDNQLPSIKEAMGPVLEFGRNMSPETIRIQNDVNGLSEKIPDSAGKTLKSEILKLKCNVTKCMYSPIKNSLCYYIADGFAEWCLSSIFAIIGIIIWSIVFIYRRETMGEDNDDDDESSLYGHSSKSKKKSKSKSSSSSSSSFS